MTTKKFYENPYYWQFEATVSKVGNNYIVLDETYFYPEGGGQCGDKGFIGEEKVIDTKEVEGEVRHLLGGATILEEGQRVKCEVDWLSRFKTMRLHSLAHMIYLAFLEVVGKSKVIGSSVTSEKCRVDFAFFGDIDTVKVKDIVQKMIDKKLDISTWEDTEKPGLRWWKVGDFSPIPCGGTHIHNTSEIGKFNISIKSLGKQGIRLYGMID